MKQRFTHQRGVSMVEALVALVVISVGMLGIAGLYLTSLQSSRTAGLRAQAVSLASDMADRIRANRRGLDAYDSAGYGGAAAIQGCDAADCTPEELAEDDIARWTDTLEASLPGGAEGEIEFDGDAGDDDPDLYTVTVRWDEAGQDAPNSYVLTITL
jgi:type IV pilus assembly protein PilV